MRERVCDRFVTVRLVWHHSDAEPTTLANMGRFHSMTEPNVTVGALDEGARSGSCSVDLQGVGGDFHGGLIVRVDGWEGSDTFMEPCDSLSQRLAFPTCQDAGPASAGTGPYFLMNP